MEELVFRVLMLLSVGIVLIALGGVLGVVFYKGIRVISLEMVTRTPSGGYYMGGGGGILNAIMGSLMLAGGGTVMAIFLSLGVAMYLQSDMSHPRIANAFRFILDILWGTPSIIYGVLGFTVMVFLGVGTSLLAGMVVLALLEIPIMARSMDEAMRSVPSELKESSYALGSSRSETLFKIVRRQAMPGIVSGILLAFGRGIGDAASILFTTGFTDHVPTSLFDSAAALPTMIFFLATSPIQEVRDRAYGAAFILLMIVLSISVISRIIAKKYEKFAV
ncbi:MAG: phosphate ABC transporter permease PstA [Methanosarcinaceae archaeon]